MRKMCGTAFAACEVVERIKRIQTRGDMTGQDIISYIVSQSLEDYTIGLQGEAGDIEWLGAGIDAEIDHENKTAVLYY